MKYEWTELTYQKILAAHDGLHFSTVCFLVYWCLPLNTKAGPLPLVIILIVPMTLFSAIAGVWLLNGDNNSSPRSV